jgi:hypothetical protein
MNEEAPPKVLYFTSGGYFGSSFEITWENGALQYYCRTQAGELIRELIEPSPAEWAAFWRALEQIGVWSWGGEFADSSVRDGTSWALELEHAGQRVEASGSNAYPPQGQGPGVPPPFRRFLGALSQLLGGREIY